MCICFKNRKRKLPPNTRSPPDLRPHTKKVRFRCTVTEIPSFLTKKLRQTDGTDKSWRQKQGRQWRAKALVTREHKASCRYLNAVTHCRLSTRCPDLKMSWTKSWEQALKIVPKGELHEILVNVARLLRLSAKTLEDSEGRWLYLQKARKLLTNTEQKVLSLLPGMIGSIETSEKKIIEAITRCSTVPLRPNLALLINSDSAQVHALLSELQLLSEGVVRPLCIKVKHKRQILRVQAFVRFSRIVYDARKKEAGKRLEETHQLLEEMNSLIYELTRRRKNCRIFFKSECRQSSWPLRYEISELETLRKTVIQEENNIRNQLCSTGVGATERTHDPAHWRQHWSKATAGLLIKGAGHQDEIWLSHWKNRSF